MRIRAGQKFSAKFLTIREDFSEGIKEKFRADSDYRTVLPFLFVNPAVTPVFFEPKPTSTVHCKEDKSVSIRFLESKRATVCALVASHGTRQSLFIIFKGRPNGRIEKNLHDSPRKSLQRLSEQRLDGLAQSELWTECTSKHYVSGCENSGC